VAASTAGAHVYKIAHQSRAPAGGSGRPGARRGGRTSPRVPRNRPPGSRMARVRRQGATGRGMEGAKSPPVTFVAGVTRAFPKTRGQARLPTNMRVPA